MADREKIFDAFRNCITEPKCKDCSWESCEKFNQAKTKIPLDLCLDILKLLKEQEEVDKNTGEWKNGHCSCCGEDVSSMLDTWTNVQNFLFCPKCGAKMEER